MQRDLEISNLWLFWYRKINNYGNYGHFGTVRFTIIEFMATEFTIQCQSLLLVFGAVAKQTIYLSL